MLKNKYLSCNFFFPSWICSLPTWCVCMYVCVYECMCVCMYTGVLKICLYQCVFKSVCGFLIIHVRTFNMNPCLSYILQSRVDCWCILPVRKNAIYRPFRCVFFIFYLKTILAKNNEWFVSDVFLFCCCCFVFPWEKILLFFFFFFFSRTAFIYSLKEVEQSRTFFINITIIIFWGSSRSVRVKTLHCGLDVCSNPVALFRSLTG